MSIKTICAGIGVLALAVGLSAGLAVQAQASTVPVIYNLTEGWAAPQVRPAWIYIGQGGAPMAHTWHWNTWNSRDAKSTGTLVLDNCQPNCALGAASYYRVYVTLSGVKHHDGRAYYSVLTWYTPGLRTKSNGHWSHTMTLHFRYFAPGTTSPGWF
jgi:hypothetical protein